MIHAVSEVAARVQQWVVERLGERDGQALVEYALIVALVAIAAIVGLHFLGGAAENTLNNVATTVNSAG
jgi:pilus assembly protein Flp/PilA